MNDPPGVERQDGPATTPSTIVWFKVYAGLMLLSGVMMFALGVVLIVIPSLSLGARHVGLTEAVMGIIYAGWGTIVSVPYLVALFVKPKGWVWTFDMVLIAFGMLNCYCWPLSIPLLIAWTKPEIKAYFGA
jgi:hypothetical protein